MDELILAKIRHDKEMEQDPDFLENSDFVLSRGHGYPMTRAQGCKLKLLMKECGIVPSQHVWHDFHHSYATILSENKMNEKVISKILGYQSKKFTQEVYVIHKQDDLIYDSSEEMENFITSLDLSSNNTSSNMYDLSDFNPISGNYM